MPSDIVPDNKLPDYLREVPENKIPPSLQEKKPEQPGMMRQAYEFLGKGPGIAALAGEIAGGALAPETGGLSLLIPALTAGAAAGGVSALQGGKDPITTGVTSGIGSLGGGLLQKGGGWLLGKAANTFQGGKYIGNIGKKMAEMVNLPAALKDEKALYSALHYDPNKSVFDSVAGDAVKTAYRNSMKKITDVVGEGAAITGDAARQLREILFQHSPSFGKTIERDLSKFYATGTENAAFNEAIRAKYFSEPLKVTDAMDLAQDLGRSAVKAGGKAGKANSEFRKTLSNALDQLAPDTGVGKVYSDMNFNYRRGLEVLRAFDVHEKKLFKTTPGGPVLDRAALIKASNEAQRSLKKAGADEIDPLIRYGREPGATSTVWNLHGNVHPGGSSVGGLRAYLPNISVENPLRPPPKISNELLRKILKSIPGATVANIGAQIGE